MWPDMKVWIFFFWRTKQLFRRQWIEEVGMLLFRRLKIFIVVNVIWNCRSVIVVQSCKIVVRHLPWSLNLQFLKQFNYRERIANMNVGLQYFSVFNNYLPQIYNFIVIISSTSSIPITNIIVFTLFDEINYLINLL